MPTFRKLEEHEIRRRGKGNSQRAQIAQEYDTYLKDFAPNEYGEVTFDEEAGEKKLTVRNRLKAAAERRGWGVEFLRTPGNAIRFHVLEGSAAASNGDNGSSNSQEGDPFPELNQAEITKPQGRKRKGKQAAAAEEGAFPEAPAAG